MSNQASLPTDVENSNNNVTIPAAAAGGVQHSSHHNSGMQSSVLRFKNLNFIVGKADTPKYILRDINGMVKWGHVLAVMGPSGAGKTTLINMLTLNAFSGKPTGFVTLNGVSMTDKMFKTHCYVVVQQDKHWPYLTCRETLQYAAELYNVTTSDQMDAVVNNILTKMGLDICANTRNARLSGGQARRLSIGIALLKSPTLLYLDEPTTGLDAAAAENIMQEIVRVAKDEHLIILCTIHQPSTKVYNGFDQVMILSKGREAFTGNVQDASPYFESIGYPVPVQTNPAEHFLDLVNADFSDDAEVDRILNTWEEKRPDAGSSHHKKSTGATADDEQEGVTDLKQIPFGKEMSIMFRRCSTLIIRDPILYMGRAVVALVSNVFFSAVYIKARSFNQQQAYNKMWLNIWHIGVMANMGVVAVYALNDEFKTIKRETKNGMVGPLSYVLAKTILVLPIMIIFAICALAIPAYAMVAVPISSFGMAIVIWSCTLYNFECVAECLSVWFDDPILGMLQFLNYWFGAFLFGGFLISKDDMYYPFTIFHYIMPFTYYLRSQTYTMLIGTTWQSCNRLENPGAAICVDPPTGANVLNAIGLVYPVVGSENRVNKDIAILLATAIGFKILYVVGVIVNAQKSAKIYSVEK